MISLRSITPFFLLVDLKFKEICIRVWRRNLSCPLENEILVIKHCTSFNCPHVVTKSSHAGTNCSLIVHNTLQTRQMPPFHSRATNRAAKPWSITPKPHLRSGTPGTGFRTPRWLLSHAHRCVPRVTSPPPSSPSNQELVSHDAALPCSLHTDGHRSCLSPASSQRLRALESLFKLLPPAGTFQATSKATRSYQRPRFTP